MNYDDLAAQALAPPSAPPSNVVQFPGTSPTDFDGLAGQVVQMQNQSDALHNLVAAQGSDPDRAAKALQVSKQTGIPQPAAEENLDQAQQAATLTQNTQTLQANPGLASFVASNPLAARIAQDDFNRLGAIEQLATALKSGVSTGMMSNELGRLGNVKQAAGAFGVDTPQTDQNILALQGKINAQPKLTGALGVVQGFTGFLTGLVDNAIEGGSSGGVAGAIVGAGAGAAAGGVGAIPGAAAGGIIGTAAGFNVDMARVAAGNAYIRMGEIKGADGQGLSEAGKQFGAVFTGAATYALGTYAAKIESALAGSTAESLAQQAIEKAVQTPTFARAVAEFGGGVLKGSAQGAGIMTAMEASSIIGEQIAKTVSSGDFTTDTGEIVTRLADAAVNGAVMLGALHGAMHGLSLYGDFRNAARAQQQAQVFKNLLDGSVDSKLRERDLQGFQDFMQRQTDGTPVENLYLPAETIRTLYQSAKIDPNSERAQDPLFGFVADMPEQLRQAQESGGDVVIPTADFVAHLAGSPVAEHLMPDIRVGADAMSLNEAKAFQEEYANRLKQATDQAAEPGGETPADKIVAEVRGQATSAGYSDTVASKYGALYAARYTARGERLGLDPYEAYKKGGVTIQGEPTNAEGPILGQPERGQIQFGANGPTISLFAKADSSSLIHESGHAWLEELASDASGEQAPQQLREDIGTVREWLGNDGGQFTTAQHEQFARAAEAYLMEGKAPSTALARVFSRFKDWLTKIYKTVANLDTPINDNIRGVFDRLLATDSEIAEAKQQTGLEPNFKDRKEAGMTAAEWSAYTRSIDKANQQAESTMLDKMMARVRRQRTAEYREERKQVAEGVAKDIDQRPDIAALNLLRAGKMPDGSEANVKLSTDAIRDTYGKDDGLPKGITSKDGFHPDYVAEMLGFDSGDALVKSLQGLETQQRDLKAADDKRTVRQSLIDQATDLKMAERKGELLDEASIKDEAMSAVHSEGRAELLAVELRYLRRMGARALESQGAKRKATGTEEPGGKGLVQSAQFNEQADKDMAAAMRESVNVTKPLLEAIRGHVDAILGNRTTADIGKFNAYLRDERKAAREVQQAILKKDWAAAAAAKQRQILSHILYTKAKEASAEIDRGEATFKRLASKASFKTIAQEYTDQIHDLLGRFGFDSGRGEELARGKAKSLEEFVQDKAADSGIELSVDPALYDMPGKPLADLTLSEFRALHEAIDSMRELGRGEKMITVDGIERDFDEVKQEMVDAIRALGEREKSDFYDPKDAGKLAAAKERLFGVFRGIDASLVKPEALFDQIDRDDPNGIMNRSVFRRLKEAQGNEDRWHDVAAKQMREAVKASGKGWAKRLDDVVPSEDNLVNPETGRPMKLTRKRMLSMALNWGNEGNRAKLADGYKWTQPAIKAFLDKNMTKADWNFVQKVWGMFDSHKQDLDDLQRRVTGVGLDMVHADAFETPHGRYEGGYYPIVYDAGKDFTAETHAEKNTEALFPNNYTRATTPKGSTISRVEGVKRPIQLSLDIAPWKIGQVIHDLAFREAIIDSDRLLSNNAVKKAMDDVFGSEYRKLLRPWLKHIANSRNIDDAAIGWIDKAISTARTNTVIVGIGFRLTTILKHDLTALSNSMSEVGALPMMKATAAFYKPGSLKENWKFITDRSPDMQFRMNAYDKDTMAAYNETIGNSAYTNFQRLAQHFGHLAVSYLDLGTAAPTWMAAYSKAIKEGQAEKDAIYVADKTVRNAHGAQGITDTAAIQRAKGAANLINMFYGFFNHIYNRQRTIVMQGAEGLGNLKAGEYRAATRNFGSMLAKSFYYIAIPALIEALVSKGGPDQNKDEGWGEWAGKAILAEIPAGIPILRDIARAALEGRDYEGSPIVNAVNNILRGGKDVYEHYVNDEDWSPSAGKHIATAVGLAAGLPTAAPFVAGKFLWDVNNGDADPRSIKDWYDGLTKGKVEQ